MSKASKTSETAEPEAAAVVEERLHPVLSNDEVLAARAKAAKRVHDEARKAALKEIEDAEYKRLAAESGMVEDSVNDEIVNVTIDLPDPDINSCIVVNMNTQYWHGHTYAVPRAVAKSLQEQMFRLKSYTAREIDGKKLSEFYQRPRGTVLGTGGVINGPQRAA